MLRGGTVTTFLLLSLFLLRDGGDRTLARLGALFCLSTGWWALNTTPFVPWSFTWALPLWVLSHGKYAAFWLFSRALFEDGFRLKPLDWAVWGGTVVLGSVWHLGGAFGLSTDWLGIPRQTAHIVLAASAAWIAWKGRGGDLIEPRRRARIAYVLLCSLLMIGVTASYIAPGVPGQFVSDFNVLRMFVMAVGMALLVSGLRSEEMFSAPIETVAPATAENGSVVVCTDPAEGRLLTRLQRLMEEERVYREAGLTIGALAAHVGAPEYALRRLINGRLGYRNFNAYLNAWRLADAKTALRDPAQREVPISTIALDAGFSSLGPFNRAFKTAEGVTPTEYRDGARIAQQKASPIVRSA
ncbi:MAG TPA: AraC family transcriptional regulator [Vitreimonas sp.]|uniref:helix-turn-helix domain-containing protein n=1 Tax=Vitreimonas sp. TaxID=3069702 RepID=UPI002D6AB5A9|nr:AraC family transcriptional regulator [Vitreimonas sp.]HYD86923.1 AraC family transcriptional regulator [Vitreimonas sp.]